MMILKEGEACPYGTTCPYNAGMLSGSCQGTLSTRKTTFTCEFVVNGQIIKDQGTRLPQDKTGKMKIIME